MSNSNFKPEGNPYQLSFEDDLKILHAYFLISFFILYKDDKSMMKYYKLCEHYQPGYYLFFIWQSRECRSVQQAQNKYTHTTNSLSTLHTVCQVSIQWVFFSLPLTSCVLLSPQRRVAGGAESISDPSLRPGNSMTDGQNQAVSQGQYKCLELSSKDYQENRTGERAKSF